MFEHPKILRTTCPVIMLCMLDRSSWQAWRGVVILFFSYFLHKNWVQFVSFIDKCQFSGVIWVIDGEIHHFHIPCLSEHIRNAVVKDAISNILPPKTILCDHDECLLQNFDVSAASYYRRSWYFHSNILDSLMAWLAGVQLNPVFLFPLPGRE